MSSYPDRIDSLLQVVTPENIEFEYRLAGPFRRLPAFLIDIAIQCAVLTLVSIALAFTLGAFSTGLTSGGIYILWFVLNWFYNGIFESMMNGQTPGKWILGLRVVTERGEPIDGLQAIMRNLLLAADLALALVALGLMTMSRRYQRLGDLVCGTIVIIEERHWLSGVVKLDDPRAIQLAGYLPPNFPVNRSLAKAISTYVERRRFFSLPRRREVARHLGEPLLVKFGLPADTSYDLLLCALYYRTFIADRGDDEKQLEAAQAQVLPAFQPMGMAGYANGGYGPSAVANSPWGTPPAAWNAAPAPLPQQTMAGTDFSGRRRT